MSDLQNPNPPPPAPGTDPTVPPAATPASSILRLNTAVIKAAQKKTASRSRRTLGDVGEKEKRRAQSDHEKLLSALEVKWRDLEVKSFEQDIIERHRYARRIFVLIVFWLLSILFILACQGWSKFFGAFSLDTKIMLALIGGTTASVLALFTIVAKYLFPDKRAQPSGKRILKSSASPKE